MSALLHGSLVHLAAENPDVMAKAAARWGQDSEYFRLWGSEPPRLHSDKTIQGWFEKELEKDAPDDFEFAIKTNQDPRLIGFISLFDLHWNHGDTLLFIALGERDYWGKGYGTDAVRVMLRYSFLELNLHRIGLIVFEYNPRAIRSYQKAGFVFEGRIRSAMRREGRRWDWLMMGILREEWLRMQQEAEQ